VYDHWQQGREAQDPTPDLPNEREQEELQRRMGLFNSLIVCPTCNAA
jgi:hypothetical protein